MTTYNEENEIDIETGGMSHSVGRAKQTIKKPKKKQSKSRESSKVSNKSTNKANAPAAEMTEVSLEDAEETATENRSRNRNSIALSKHEDPFAKRDGKTLIWQNVNMVLKTKNKDGSVSIHKLLSGVFGEVPAGQTTAIMGPSGAGKSSLLNILSGRATSRGRLEITSDVRLNNFAVDPTNIQVRQNIAFVAQDDSLQETSTPREAIYFSAKLRLPMSTSEAHLTKLVDRMLEELGLTHCADTIVGGPQLKGISGGERKRTSVGVELVTRPAMVFLDEPTSGLDAFSAVQLCKVLKNVANSGASVLFTIHQPSSEIFNAFDRLILMNKGKVMFQGKVNRINGFFKKRGHKVPKGYNPADWIMDVAQSHPLDQLEADGFFPKDKRRLPEPFTEQQNGKDALGITVSRHSFAIRSEMDNSTPGIVTQIKLLFQREVQNMKRDKRVLGGRLAFTAFLGILLGVIFLDVGQTDSSNVGNLQSHFGALVMVLMLAMMGTAQQALLAFPQQRPVFLREYSTNHYSVVSYFINRLTVEAVVTALQIFILVLITFWLVGFQSPFGMFYFNVYALAMASTAISVALGCWTEDPKLGQEMLPILFVPQLLFAGFFVTPDLIPSWLGWLSYIFPLTYSTRLSLVYEFGDGCGGGQADINCMNLLDSVEANDDDSWWYWLGLAILFFFF
mmetsp:Transcript_802/g.1472  ORF Transcript_802/g.1472 Transcript_802/m.1472 type:complete len:677 (-) Transcript_802:13-2043(-)